jgi:heme-degrading monooxygenase HmoA
VDYNADGTTDIFTATFDGSPWVSLGSKEGFLKPELVKDKNGERVMLSQFWDYDADKPMWTNKDHTEGVSKGAHCISAVVFDWDADGDFDIIMGDRDGGLWLTMNEGSAKEPKFAAVTKPVMVGDNALDAGGKITAPKVVDWDKDGLTDIIVGTFDGDVKLFRNAGKKGEPKLEAAKTLLKKEGSKTEARPERGTYVDVVDFDNDGDWDLLIGGYTTFKDGAAEESRPKTYNAREKPFVWVYLQKDGEKKVAKPVDR